MGQVALQQVQGVRHVCGSGFLLGDRLVVGQLDQHHETRLLVVALDFTAGELNYPGANPRPEAPHLVSHVAEQIQPGSTQNHNHRVC